MQYSKSKQFEVLQQDEQISLKRLSLVEHNQITFQTSFCYQEALSLTPVRNGHHEAGYLLLSTPAMLV